jgi:UDP-2-acetamido-3-amino-2,3-dideoxy-glucuronate N-acetyltransferase
MNLNKKICVVGGGNWGKNHIETLHRLGCLGGVVESSDTLIEIFKSIYPKCKFYKNINDSFDFSFDGYIVATPPNTHFEIAKKIISKNKPVLVEKPFTLNVKDAEELNTYAKSKKVNLYVGHLLLFHPAYMKIKEIVDDGLIGKIQYIYSNRLNLGKIRKDENVFWSFAPHDIALLQYFIGQYPNKIVSEGAAFITKNVHDTTITSLKYSNGVMCHIFVSWLHPYKEHKFIIIGSDGMISFEDSSKDKSIVYYDKKVDVITTDFTGVSEDNKLIKYEKSLALDNQLIYFLRTINDAKIEKINGDDAVNVVRILEEASNNL